MKKKFYLSTPLILTIFLFAVVGAIFFENLSTSAETSKAASSYCAKYKSNKSKYASCLWGYVAAEQGYDSSICISNKYVSSDGTYLDDGQSLQSVNSTKTTQLSLRLNVATCKSAVSKAVSRASSSVGSSSVSAAGNENRGEDPVKTYCLNLGLNSNAEKACNKTNVGYARTVATYHCNSNATSAQKVKCVESKAKSYFKDAASSKPKPTTEKAFDKSLNAVFTKVKGSKTVPDKGFGALQPSTTADCSGGTCDGVNSDPEEACKYDNHCDFIKKYINPAINLLTMVFGLIATASLILGGIQYSASEGDPTKAGQAKNRIANTIFAIIAYFFLYGFLQFLIPGGRFN